MNGNELYAAIRAANAKEDWPETIRLSQALIGEIVRTGEVPDRMVDINAKHDIDSHQEAAITILSMMIAIVRGRMP